MCQINVAVNNGISIFLFTTKLNVFKQNSLYIPAFLKSTFNSYHIQHEFGTETADQTSGTMYGSFFMQILNVIYSATPLPINH